jgi:hypothetical protein
MSYIKVCMYTPYYSRLRITDFLVCPSGINLLLSQRDNRINEQGTSGGNITSEKGNHG